MITTFLDFVKINEDKYIDTAANGPIIQPKGDPGIGFRGGANGGIIGGADASGDFFKFDGPTAKGDRHRFNNNVKYIKKKEKPSRRRFTKTIDDIEKDIFDSNL